MKVEIYGRSEGCQYCTRAKNICEAKGYDMNFIDIDEIGYGMTELQDICGAPVRTIPQIFVDDTYIGGCDKFEEYLKSL